MWNDSTLDSTYCKERWPGKRRNTKIHHTTTSTNSGAIWDGIHVKSDSYKGNVAFSDRIQEEDVRLSDLLVNTHNWPSPLPSSSSGANQNCSMMNYEFAQSAVEVQRVCLEANEEDRHLLAVAKVVPAISELLRTQSSRLITSSLWPSWTLSSRRPGRSR